MVHSAKSCACISVGKPGYGMVSVRRISFGLSGELMCSIPSPAVITEPASFSFAAMLPICSVLTFVSVSSPPVIAAAVISVPATILSGIMRCVTFFSAASPPRMVMVELPAPSILYPSSFKNRARSSISGSLAALNTVVFPSAHAAAIIMFSVAPTLG